MTINDKQARPAGNADERALNERQAAILEAVVTEYIGSAEPVGSSHVANAPGVQVSSATVRSEMVALERDGYLEQPHTSAGRIPTDKGYRFFVDHLEQLGGLDAARESEVKDFFARAHGEIERMLSEVFGMEWYESGNTTTAATNTKNVGGVFAPEYAIAALYPDGNVPTFETTIADQTEFGASILNIKTLMWYQIALYVDAAGVGLLSLI